MASDPIVFAMANPDPEIRPELIADVAAVIATGRSDFPNQINNVLAFPGVFRGALDAGARKITENMKVAAAEAIAAVRSRGRAARPTSSSRRCSTASWLPASRRPAPRRHGPTACVG